MPPARCVNSVGRCACSPHARGGGLPPERSAGTRRAAAQPEFDVPSASRALLVNCWCRRPAARRRPAGAYGILDTGAGTLSVRRVSYDVAARSKDRCCGLPELLAHRLGRAVRRNSEFQRVKKPRRRNAYL
jgi:hypothetical protein